MKRHKPGRARLRLTVFAAVAILLCMFSLVAPHIAPNDPYQTDLQNTLQPPGDPYPFGTDALGRCLLSRILYGASSTIFSSIALVLLTFAFGTVIGMLCGYFGGAFDAVVMRFVDVIQAFPQLVLCVAIAAVLGTGLTNAMLAIFCVRWTHYARLARGQTLSVCSQTYINAARLSGCSPLQVIFRHVLPNVSGTLIVTAALDIGAMMMELAGLSFLGLGAAPPSPEWGAMMSDGRSMFQQAPWLTLYPGVAILLSIIVFNLLGDSVRDSLDPKKA